MAGGEGADRATFVGNSMCMIMECKSYHGERETNEEETGNLLIHRPMKSGANPEPNYNASIKFGQ
jgi:hypothetical protein